MNNLYDVIIIGGGPAGLSAGLYLTRAKCKTLIIEKESFGGQVKTTEEVVNYPGILTTSGEKLTSTMKEQARNFGTEFLTDEIVKIDLTADVKTITTKTKELKALGVIIATGARPRQIGFKGEADYKGKGVAYCATCDGEFFKDKEVFVIGGGYVAAEESVFLTRFAKKVTILIRENDFTCAASVADKAKNNSKIQILTNTEVKEISGSHIITNITYTNNLTEETTTYENKEGFGVFVFAGYVPETKLVEGVIELNNYKYIKVDRNQKTNIDGVYAAGDVVEKNLRQVVTAVSDGAIAATELEKYVEIMHEKTGLKPEFKPVEEEVKTKQEESLFDEDTTSQLKSLFNKFEDKLTLEYSLDEREISRELFDYLTNITKLTDKLELKENKGLDGLKPYVRVLKKDKPVGMEFHGVPGGHEFTSFILSLYNHSSKGQEIDLNIVKKAKELGKTHLDIFVTLSCSLCPDLVTKANKLASINPNIEVSVYDINQFESLKTKYNVMSVPCMIYKEKVYFGKKTYDELIEIIKK